MKLPSYKEVLQMGKEKLEESLIPIRTKKARKQAELELCSIEEQIATKEAKIHELCTKKDLEFSSIFSNMDSLELLQRKKKQYESLISQMFPE